MSASGRDLQVTSVSSFDRDEKLAEQIAYAPRRF
jgi:hypothetical protein